MSVFILKDSFLANFRRLKWLQILLIVGGCWAQLRPEDVEEGQCIYPFPNPVTLDRAFLTKFVQSANRPFYVPMGSQHLYRAYASNLLGRAPNSKEELELMSLRIRGSVSHTWVTTGYSQSFIQQCIPYGHPFRAFCLGGLGSPATDLRGIRQTTDTLVYTDNKKVLLFVRCVMGRENDWKVLSTTPEIEEENKERILETVTGLGFDPAMAAYYNYSEYDVYDNSGGGIGLNLLFK